MPELPEVESGRRTVERYLLDSPIARVNLLEQGGGPRDGEYDDIIIQASQQAVEFFLKGRHISSCHRRGKQLYFAISSSSSSSAKGKAKASVVEGYLLMHFGMTGAFVVKDEQVPQYKAVKVDQVNFPPRFCKLHLVFENGRQLAFSDPRRLGRVHLLQGRDLDPLHHLPLSKLGRDPLLDGVPPEFFQAKLSQSVMPIKALLLDQEKVLCGIGNYLVDEILYQCRVHPRSVSSAIPEAKAAELAAATERIINTACDCTDKFADFPSDWIFHYRWGKGKTDDSPKKSKVSGGSPSKGEGFGAIEGLKHNRMPDGGVISFDTVGGRTSAVVEAVQVKYTGKAKAEGVGKGKGKGAGKAAKTSSSSKLGLQRGAGSGGGECKQMEEEEGDGTGVGTGLVTPVKAAKGRGKRTKAEGEAAGTKRAGKRKAEKKEAEEAEEAEEKKGKKGKKEVEEEVKKEAGAREPAFKRVRGGSK